VCPDRNARHHNNAIHRQGKELEQDVVRVASDTDSFTGGLAHETGLFKSVRMQSLPAVAGRATERE